MSRGANTMRLNPSHCVRRCWHDEASREELHDDASDVRNTHARSLGSPAPCALSQPCYRCRSVRGARCRLTAIGITSAKRSSAMPDLPTIAESGLPGYDFLDVVCVPDPVPRAEERRREAARGNGESAEPARLQGPLGEIRYRCGRQLAGRSHRLRIVRDHEVGEGREEQRDEARMRQRVPSSPAYSGRCSSVFTA